jgi:hypothetical protein
MTRHAVALLFASLVTLDADTLTLRNGSSVTGSWVGIDAGQISFQVNNQLQTFKRLEVSAVTFGPQMTDESKPPISGAVEPELLGAVYMQDQSGKLLPLERIKAEWHRVGEEGNHPFGKPFWRLEGANSPIRVKGGTKVTFVVKLANGIDPNTFSLVALISRKNQRLSKGDPHRKYDATLLLFNVTKFGESSYAMIPAADLPPGEYGFGARDAHDAYCFGVD